MSIHNAKSGTFGVQPQPKKIPKKQILSSIESIKKSVGGAPVQVRMTTPMQPTEQKSRKKQANYLDGKLIHVKVGDVSWDPVMLQSEIDKVGNQLNGLMDANDVDCMIFVTHWAVDLKVIDSQQTKEGTGAPL